MASRVHRASISGAAQAKGVMTCGRVQVQHMRGVPLTLPVATRTCAPYSHKRAHFETAATVQQDAFDLFGLPEELTRCVISAMWSTADRQTKQAARLVCRKMRSWCSELVENVMLEYREFSEFANNKTRRQAWCFQLPRAFPNVRYIKLSFSRVSDPWEHSPACADATRAFFSKVADEFPLLEKLKVIKWPGPRGMTRADMEVLVRKCPHLSTLHVHSSAAALSRLSQLKDLRTLCLMNMTLDDAGMQVVAQLPRLQYLHASVVVLMGGPGTAALASLQNLLALQLDATQFNNLAIQAVGHLTSLTRLYLGTLSAQVTSPYLASSLANLSRLHDLTLRRSDPTGFCQADLFRSLGALPSLRRLVLHSNLDLQPLSRTAGFTSLQSLHLVFAASHSRVLQYLKLDRPWPKLTDLVLGYFQVEDPGMVFSAISKQTQLQSLMVVSMNNNVTDGTLMQLTSLQQLSSLKVKLCGTSAMPSQPAVTAVRSALPRLRKFGIDEFRLKLDSMAS